MLCRSAWSSLPISEQKRPSQFLIKIWCMTPEEKDPMSYLYIKYLYILLLLHIYIALYGKLKPC